MHKLKKYKYVRVDKWLSRKSYELEIAGSNPAMDTKKYFSKY
jgi:hypothetical protein